MERVQTHRADSDRSSRRAVVEKAPIERPELASIGDTAQCGSRLRASRCGSPLKREIRIEDRTVAQHCDVVAVVHRH